ncbi:beta-glucanase/beta-glucan synthetase [Bacillus sp. FJAT-49705]|uniref:Beta-glucanase/beta-glucan synthetase n=1 Tax=Cytobacillus citreus TaxID=2833586 RepID=A0ABS5NPM8_9BACI|nr:beta-glucanase/beta-glucan synthetase [Cytobacillus citreus]MBS4189763.1 beta-glucanase/beta-glucan synthetase [Cytobacillus citreus]
MGKYGFLRNALLLMALVVLIVGCSNQNQNSNKDDSDTTSYANDNPFEVNGEDTVMMGAIGHGFVNPELDESGERRLPLQYDGGELEINYFVNASGKAKNVGFLVFVDGIPQPYKFNTTEASYEYMHIFDLEEDDKDTPFTFVFTPVTGKQGETLNVSITSIYNPAFIPDMKETSSYGGYHETLEVLNPLFFEKDAEALEASKIPKNNYLNNVSLSNEPITEKLLEKHSVMQKIDLETLEKQVLSELYFDGDSAMNVDNLQVNDSGTLHVTFKLFGHPGVKYQNTFYINHQALSTKDGDTSFEMVLTKGEVTVIDMEIDLERLEDINTFYVTSVPMNAGDFPDDAIDLQKTESILLYK